MRRSRACNDHRKGVVCFSVAVEDSPAPRYLGFGPYVLDRRRAALWHDGVEVPLTPRALDVLTVLVDHAGETLTKDQLIDLVWGGVVVDENNLARHVSTLRRALHERPGQREYIATLPGVGYRFVPTIVALDALPISSAAAPAPSPLPSPPVPSATSATPPTSPPTQPSPRRWLALWAAAGAVLIAVLVIVVGSYWRSQPVPPSTQQSLWQFTHEPGSQLHPTWSPDGLSLAFAAYQGENSDIWVQPLNAPEATRLTSSPANDWQPDWSADGEWIVFRSERTGGGLFVMPARGGAERRIASFGTHPQWSPTTSLVLFSNAAPDTAGAVRMFVVAPGNTPRELTHPDLAGLHPTSAAWSPDGRVTFWARDDRGARVLLTVPVDGGPVTRSTLPPEMAQPGSGPDLLSFTWAPSGRFIYFEGLSQQVRNLWRVAVDPETLNVIGPLERLTVGAGADAGIAVSPDGRRLAFGVSTSRVGIWTFGFDPAAGRVLDAGTARTSGDLGERSADASGDGLNIAFRSVRNDRQEIWMQASDEAPRLLVSDADWLLTPPRWSPDGTRLAYQRTRRGLAVPEQTNRTITILDVNSRQETSIPVAPDQEFVPADWSVDGRTLIGACRLNREDPLGTCLLPMSATRTESSLSLLASADGSDLVQQRISPNQRWISFAAIPLRDRSATTVYVMPANGGPWTAVTDGAWYDDKPRWAPDGRTIYFVSNRDGHFEVWARRFDPVAGTMQGEAFRVTTFGGSSQVLSPYLGQLEMSISSSRVLLPMSQISGRVWILDGVDR